MLRRSRDNNIRFLWIDDIVEPASAQQEDEASATTFAYVSEGSGKSHVRYHVTLGFSAAAADYRKGDLERILPEAHAIDWLAIDRAGNQLTINLGA